MALTRIRAQQISNIDYKQATRVVTTSNIVLNGGAPNTVDNVELAVNNRVLVTGQSTASQNGIYFVQALGAGSNGTWVRSTDSNSTGELESGTIIMVTEGQVYADTQWKLITDDPITIGSTALNFVQNYLANSISAGTSNVAVNSSGNVAISSAGTSNVAVFSSGSTVFKGNVLPAANITYNLGSTTQRWQDIWLSNSTIYLGNTTITANSTNPLLINGQGVVTTSATDSISLTGNITGSYIFGNGSQLTGISTSSYSNSDVTSLLANFGSNTISSTGTITTTANISGGNLSGTSIVGTLTTAAQTNITSVGTLSGLTVVGVSNFTGNVDITGNINATGNLNYSNVTDLVVGDPLIYIGEDNPGNVYDLGLIVSWNDGTYQHGGWVRDASDGTWKLFGNVIPEPTTTVDFTNATYQAMRAGAITATTGTFSGNVTSGNLSGTNIVGTLTTAAQTNITSVGTLGSLTVTGNVTGGNIVTAGQVSATGNVSGGNLNVTGNIFDTGALSLITGSSGNINLAPNGTNVLVATTTGVNIAGTLTATGNISGGNLLGTSISGTLTTAAQTNITSVGTLGSLTVTGNVTVDTSTLFVDSVNNRVGIGNANPSSPFVASAPSTSNVTLTWNSGVGQILRNENSEFAFGLLNASPYPLYIQGRTNTDTVRNISINPRGGDVGIGNLSPTHALSVNGTGYFSGNVTVGNLSGTNIVGTLTTAAQTNITSVGTLGSLTVTGNVNAGNLSGTSIVGTLTTAAQTNITSVGTLGSLTVTANVTGGNIVTAGQVTATGNVTGGNLNVTGNIVDTGALSLITGSSGNINLAPNGTNVLIATTTGANVTGTLTATGNITGGNLSGTSIVGTLTTAAQINITSVGTLTGANVTASNVSVGITDSYNSSTSTKNLKVVSGSRDLSFIANIGGGSYNSLTTTNDSAIIFTGPAIGNAGFTIAPWAGATTGIRISSAANVATIRLAATTIQIDGAITNGQANGVGNIGNSTTYFNTVFAKATSAQYADLAEKYTADADYLPGTVVIFGGTHEVTTTVKDHDTRIAGVVSTDPAYLMNSGAAGLPIALTGRVPTRVAGPVAKGDVLVTSTTAGVAQRIDNNKFVPGCVLGKALDSIDSGSIQVIEVVVGRF